MPRTVQIIQRREVFKRFVFRIEEATLRHEKFDGTMGPEITRLVFQRGDSVALLLVDPATRTLLLCEQFRFPTCEKGPGWLLELPAGMIEHDEDPKECARRETLEETGYEVNALDRISCVYLSPGGSSERIHIFYGEISMKNQAGSGGGLESEGEDIRLLRVTATEAITMAHDGRIEDAKTLIAILWLELKLNADARAR